MEEVERICSRIAIMDKGKVIATGTTAELKGMIKTGEKITAELLRADTGVVSGIRQIPFVVSAEINGGQLIVKSEHGKNNLPAVLDYLNGHSIGYGRIFCELPTLNDVFLEITGKELRD
jgi:ABC-2 type transport system ATP-binding protein